ncbi:MAG: hypothetical protein Q9227_001706 [Pyrenula ochraceoflavens]
MSATAEASSETPRRRITRNRELQACSECRRRKLRCDRGVPCQTCVKRNDGSSCVYERRLGDNVARERQRRIEAEARLVHLEQLVQRIATSEEDPSGSQASVLRGLHSEPSPDKGVPLPNLDLNGTTSPNGVYSGSTHWSAMLEDIEELRYAITMDESSFDDAKAIAETTDIDILFGCASPVSLSDVFSQYLPARTDADRMVATYFRSKALCVPFLHGPQFQRQYESFWLDPLQAPPLWTSMLFSIFYITSTTLCQTKGKPESVDRGNSYGVAAANCLTLGHYHQPKQFAVQALMLCAQAKLLSSFDMTPEIGIIMGIVVRLAITLGLHRDPDLLGRMSVFEAEMRRRMWSMCIQLDMLVSFQLGLPSNVQYPTWDTKPPANLLDSDFDEDTPTLPPARPDSEPTDILFYIAKHRIMAIFEKIVRHSLAGPGSSGEAELESLDAEISETWARLPQVLQPRSMMTSIVDPPSLLVTRLCVYLIYQKSVCVLHRKYVLMGRDHSIQRCLDAASNIVRQFLDIYKEFQPGGQLETERWFLGSITWHDFLLAVTVLCLIICTQSQRKFRNPAINSDSILTLLKGSLPLCQENLAASKDTNRVRQLIEAVIPRFENPHTHWLSNGTSSINSEGTLRLELSSEQQVLTPIFATDRGDDASSDLRDFGQDVSRFADGNEWAYLEQFLNLPVDLDTTDSQTGL